ncbi:hypothetical protein LV28_00070 [Pandoraea pnomenusa]|nr:hypothetical protein [Pandoraea pnomenusa]AIU25171.1 hypothetical protein LV28_00070 [Pandoraea pnomenusa]
MFDIDESPNTILERNRTSGETLAKVSRSPGLKATDNEAGIRQQEAHVRPTWLMRFKSWLLENIIKVVGSVTVAGVIAIAKYFCGI